MVEPRRVAFSPQLRVRGAGSFRVAVAVAAVLVLPLAAGPAHAADPSPAGACPVIAGGADKLALVDGAERLRFLQREMRAAARDARIWSYTWAGLYGSIATAQLLQLPLTADDHRNTLYVAAGASAIGVIAGVVAPLKIMRDQRWLDRRLAEARPGDDPCALLAETERRLTLAVKGEAFKTSWLTHAGTLLVNVGVGLVMALWLREYQQAAISVVAGEVLGELQVNTLPVGATRVLARYRAGDSALSPSTSAPKVGWLVAPILGANRWGLQATFVY